MPSRGFLGLLGLGVAGLYAAILGAMRFHLCLNDFWAWSFFASRLDLSDAATLYNGFMPPAYAVFLNLVGPSREIAAAFALTLLAVVVTVFVVGTVAAKLGGRSAGLIAALLLAGWTPFVESGLTAGPDVIVAGLVAVAARCVWTPPRSGSAMILAALVLAVAILTRGHALLAGIALLAAPVLHERRLRGFVGFVVVGLLTGMLVQVAINLAAGQAAWSNAQAFNVYKMVHGMDWYAPAIPTDLSVLDVFRDAPVEFLRGWAGAIARAGIWLVGPAFAWWYARREGDSGLQRYSALAVLAGLVYVIPVSLGDSPRAMVVLAGILIPPVAGLVLHLRRASFSVRRVVGVLIVALAVAVSFRGDRAFLSHNFGQARDFAAIEDALAGRGPVRARQVFTDDFDLYFRGLEGQRPLTRGGWGLVGIEGWTDEFPQLNTGTRAGFLESCAAHDVRYLALTRRSRRLGQEFSRFYHDPIAAGLTVLGEYGEFVLLELPESARTNEEARP